MKAQRIPYRLLLALRRCRLGAVLRRMRRRRAARSVRARMRRCVRVLRSRFGAGRPIRRMRRLGTPALTPVCCRPYTPPPPGRRLQRACARRRAARHGTAIATGAHGGVSGSCCGWPPRITARCLLCLPASRPAISPAPAPARPNFSAPAAGWRQSRECASACGSVCPPTAGRAGVVCPLAHRHPPPFQIT